LKTTTIESIYIASEKRNENETSFVEEKGERRRESSSLRNRTDRGRQNDEPVKGQPPLRYPLLAPLLPRYQHLAFTFLSFAHLGLSFPFIFVVFC
jgi:hypothetical protein